MDHVKKLPRRPAPRSTPNPRSSQYLVVINKLVIVHHAGWSSVVIVVVGIIATAGRVAAGVETKAIFSSKSSGRVARRDNVLEIGGEILQTHSGFEAVRLGPVVGRPFFGWKDAPVGNAEKEHFETNQKVLYLCGVIVTAGMRIIFIIIVTKEEPVVDGRRSRRKPFGRGGGNRRDGNVRRRAATG
jgi:hypothetical protein